LNFALLPIAAEPIVIVEVAAIDPAEMMRKSTKIRNEATTVPWEFVGDGTKNKCDLVDCKRKVTNGTNIPHIIHNI